MKKKLLMSTLLLTLFGGLTLGVAACDSGKKEDDIPVIPMPPVEEDVITKALVCDTSKMKTNYYVDDLFDPNGLEVRLVTTKNGVKDDGVLTTDYTLSIKEGTALKTTDNLIQITSTEADVTGTSFEITISENQVYKYLVADTSKMKTDYYVDETLDATGLVVTMFTDTNGVVDEGVEFTDYTLSIKSDKKLATTDNEVIVKSNEKGILSTQFSISVKPRPILTSLYDYISFIVETNNYTVNSQIGQSNEIKGLVTSNGVQWSSSDESYYLDVGVGYGDYKGNTFRFKNSSGTITDQRFINDLGGDALDYGLFDPRTVDEFAENRISNYSIKGITKAELNYLKTVKPTEENQNKYEIDIHYSKWLWNAIGNTQLTRDPVKFLDKGINSGRIFVELIDGGLKVNLVPPLNGYIDSCTATISAIGETEIPGLKEFLANPTFPGSRLDLPLLNAQKMVRDNNYTVTSADGTRVAYYTKEYGYGECLDTNKDDTQSFVYLGQDNNQKLEEGYYKVKTLTNGFEVIPGDLDPIKTPYLSNYDIWKFMNKYFTKVSANNYKYTVVEELGANPQITSFIPYFMDVDIETAVLKEVQLVLNTKGSTLESISFKVLGEEGLIGEMIIKDFGKTKYEPLENYIKTLY